MLLEVRGWDRNWGIMWGGDWVGCWSWSWIFLALLNNHNSEKYDEGEANESADDAPNDGPHIHFVIVLAGFPVTQVAGIVGTVGGWAESIHIAAALTAAFLEAIIWHGFVLVMFINTESGIWVLIDKEVVEVAYQARAHWLLDSYELW